MLIVNQKDNCTKTKFYKILNYLKPGDVMVLNDSKVIKAKLALEKKDKKIDFYLNKKMSDNCWRGFARPAQKLKEGDEFNFGTNKITISKKLEMGETEIEFKLDNISVFEFLEKYGQSPLPPYIERSGDEERYQTVYNDRPGSVAAPTAGLHFTDELLIQIKEKGVKLVYLSLHVGAGTSLPVKTEDIEQHKMHGEYCIISNTTADIINEAKKQEKRVIAIGTTTLRTLESSVLINSKVNPGEVETEIFIKPGFKFQIVDMLITNFHLPKTTLFILVCAFAGFENMINAYKICYKRENALL